MEITSTLARYFDSESHFVFLVIYSLDARQVTRYKQLILEDIACPLKADLRYYQRGGQEGCIALKVCKSGQCSSCPPGTFQAST
jgi:hypothetical protein